MSSSLSPSFLIPLLGNRALHSLPPYFAVLGTNRSVAPAFENKLRAFYLYFSSLGLFWSALLCLPSEVHVRATNIYSFTAWIGSLAMGLSYFCAPVAGRLSERFGCRVVTIFGGFTCALSLAITSLANSISHVTFSYGLMFGLGASCVRTCTFLVVAKYFYRRRSFATGVISSGPGIGMFMYGPLIQQLLALIGLHSTYRVLAGFSLLVCLLAGSFSPNVDEEKEEHKCRMETNQRDQDSNEKQTSFTWRRVLDCSAWKTPAFTVITIAYTVICLGDFVPLIHLVSYGGMDNLKKASLDICGLCSYQDQVLMH